MLQAFLNNKLSDIDMWKEDLKTSTVLGNLIYLPSSEICDILKKAYDIRLGPFGELVDYSFWPKFSADDESISNSRYVEPDVIFRFEKLDVIIEVKIGEWRGQYEQQWNSEVGSFFLEYECSKPVILIALGGCTNLQKEERSVEVGNKQINYSVYKSTWHSLLSSLKKEYDRLSDAAYKRIIGDIISRLNKFGVRDTVWLETLNRDNLHINQNSISLISSVHGNTESD